MATLGYKKPNLQSYIAGADLSAKQYTFVKFDTTIGQVVACGAGEVACGVLMDLGVAGGVAGAAVGVAMPGGGALLKAGGAMSPGDPVKSDASGEGVEATADGDFYGARVDAIGADAADGDLVPVIVTDSYLFVGV